MTLETTYRAHNLPFGWTLMLGGLHQRDENPVVILDVE